MMGVAAAQMAKFYGLPAAIATGVSDSKVPDAQSAYEAAINMTQVALSRPPVVFGAGGMESGLTFDLAKLIMDWEHLRHLRIALEGIPVDDYHLATEEISAVGPGGNHLLQGHTLENMRKQSETRVFDRSTRDRWERGGSPDVVENAYRTALEIIENHRPLPLPAGAGEQIAALVREHEERLSAEGRG